MTRAICSCHSFVKSDKRDWLTVSCSFILNRSQSRVEWFSIFLIIENGHIAVNCLFFYDHVFKNRRIPLRARQNFHFQKITETLKMNIFFGKLLETFLIRKRTMVKNNIQLRICLVSFLIFQKWRKRFLTYNKVKIFF